MTEHEKLTEWIKMERNDRTDGMIEKTLKRKLYGEERVKSGCNRI